MINAGPSYTADVPDRPRVVFIAAAVVELREQRLSQGVVFIAVAVVELREHRLSQGFAVAGTFLNICNLPDRMRLKPDYLPSKETMPVLLEIQRINRNH